MNRITISLISLVVISMVLPTSSIMYASGQSTTSDNSGSSTSDSGSESTTTTSDNSGSSTGGGTTTDDNAVGARSSSDSGSTTTTTTDNNNGASSSDSGSTASNNVGNTQGVDVNGILALHNKERAAVGVPPLTWSNTLAASAQTWADQLLATGNSGHSTCCGAFRDYGENIASAGPPADKSQIGLVQGWVDEKKNYVPCNPCNYGGTGHYTQMVWKASTEVGCGFASGPGGAYAQYGGTDVLVCQYTPPGNWNNQPPY
jgi:uncharacterized protein YkwD